MAVGLAALALIAPRDAIARAVPLWIKLQPPCPNEVLSPQAQRCDVVKVNPAVFAMANVELKLELPDGTTVEATKVEFQQPTSTVLIWHGKVPGKSFSSVTFSVFRDAVVGTVAHDGLMFRLRLTSGGLQVVEMLDLEKLPKAGEPVEYPPPPPPPPPDCEDSSDPACAPSSGLCLIDSPNRIDVLVVSTTAANLAAGGTDAIKAWINLQVFETNRSLLLSNTNLQIQLAADKEITGYTETSNSSSLEALTAKDDDILDEVHDWRGKFNADAVVLITHVVNGGISGLANPMRDHHIPDANYVSFEPYAFAVVDAGGFQTAEFSFAHELGHLLGAQHNKDTGDGTIAGAIPESSYGYLDETPGSGCNPWMTIMAVRESGDTEEDSKCVNCDRLPYWSNDDETIKRCGESMGSEVARNRNTLNLTASIVSRFRCGAAPNNVWMKDTWEDTGTEPDPGQATEDMWKSPYVWIRQKKDDEESFPEQHRHQNPVKGQPNFVYAKLHNGGGTAEGVLQFWAANASTGLSWPASFTKIGEKAVTGLTVNSTRVIPLEWTPLESGHFCLVARWLSAADPMVTPEIPNLDAYVRGNNNVIWRNINIVELGSLAQASSAQIFIVNPQDETADASLVIRPSDRNPEHSFLRFGEVTLRLDPRLMNSWRRSDFRGSGFRRVENEIQITDSSGAILEGLRLKPGVQMRIEIVFHRPRDNRIVGTFFVDVIQNHVEREKARVIGGVTYEVRVENH